MSDVELKLSPAARTMTRMMALIPILYANPGISLQSLRKIATYSRPAELRRDLDRLMLMGVPPFGPDDFVGIDIEDDRVYLHYPQGLERPLGFTDSEWLLLLNLIREAIAFPFEDSDDSVLQELVRKIAPIPLDISNPDQENFKIELIQEALHEKQQLRFGYLSVASREIEIRHLDPWKIFLHRGSFYVIGYCHTRQATRNFHLDRMEDIEILDIETQHPRPENIVEILENSPIFRSNPAGFSVKLAFDPDARAALELQMQITDVQPISSMPAPQNWSQGSCKIESRLWLLQRLRSYGAAIKVLEPEFLASEYASDIANTPVPQAIEPIAD